MRLLMSSTAFIVIRRMTRNLFGDFLLKRLLTEFRGGDLFGRYRYPLGSEKVPQISQIYTDFFESQVNRFVQSQGVSATTEQVASAKFRVIR